MNGPFLSPTQGTGLNRLLYWMFLLNSNEIEQIIRKAGKEIFDVCPKMSGDTHVT